MRKFVNNWVYELGDILPAGDGSLPLPAGAQEALGLGDGDSIVLTITHSLRPDEQDAFEFVLVARDAGAVSVERGALGTATREWPAGAVIYAALPAEQMNEWQAAIAALQAGGSGGGVQIVNAEPDVETTAPGAAFLVSGDRLAISLGEEYSRFERIESGFSNEDEPVNYADFPRHQPYTTRWTTSVAPTIEGPGPVSGEVYNYRWLLIQDTLQPLSLVGFDDGLLANCPATDVGGGEFAVTLPGATCWLQLFSSPGGPWVLIAEPLQTPTV